MRPTTAKASVSARAPASGGQAGPVRRAVPAAGAARAGAALAAFGFLTWAASLPLTRRVDEAVTLWLQRAAPAPDLPASLLMSLGNAEVVLPAAVLVGVLLMRRHRRAGVTVLWLAAGLTLVSLLAAALKFLIVHPGPSGVFHRPGLGFGLRVGTPYSFPSGHTVRTTLLAGAALRRWWWLVGLVIAGMMTALVYLGAHWLSEVLGGLCLGWAGIEGWEMLTTARSRNCPPG